MGQKNYFPALDCLRAIAMLMVFITHFEGVMAEIGLGPYSVDWLTRFSAVGLTLFFVLSGFLITYLLLTEQQEFHTIHVPSFYIRRMLRIWPLYYLIILVGQFLIPATGLLGLHPIDSVILGQHFWSVAACYLLFLPNIAFMLLRPLNPYVSDTWSIGAEEQFYLVWPWVLKKCGRHLPAVLWILIFCSAASSCLYDWLYRLKLEEAGLPGGEGLLTGTGMILFSKIITFISWSRIGYFALGGLMAYYKLRRPVVVERLTDKRVLRVCLLVICGMMVRIDFTLKEFILAVMLSVVVLNATQPGTMLQRFKSPALIWLGKISYGMYLFHFITIVIACKLLVKLGGLQLSAPVFCLLAYPLGLGLTILAGVVSYKYFESFFLRWKKKFEFVRTVDPDPLAARAEGP